jgi:acyl-CoA synthetase (AMP-forming)/AMP-acid ligase II
VLYFNNHRDNTVWYWSVIAAGAVPAVLSPLSSNEVTLVGELENVGKLFKDAPILTTKQLAKPFRTMASLNTVTAEVVATVKVEAGYRDGEVNEATKREDELATILFTSGSTGFAKGVEYTHAQLVTSSKLKSAFHHMDSSKTFMSWVSTYLHTQNLLAGFSR